MHLEEYVLGKARVPGLLCEECIFVKARVRHSFIHLDDVYHNCRFWLLWKIESQNHVSQIVGRHCALVCKSHPMAFRGFDHGVTKHWYRLSTISGSDPYTHWLVASRQCCQRGEVSGYHLPPRLAFGLVHIVDIFCRHNEWKSSYCRHIW